MNQLFYSRLFYNKISKIPKISLKATRFNEEEKEILKLDRLFGSAVLSQDEFYDVMYFKETAIPILQITHNVLEILLHKDFTLLLNINKAALEMFNLSKKPLKLHFDT